MKPGDTLWVRGGVYRGHFTSRLAGSSTAPIHVRPYQGGHVIIETSEGKSPLDVYGQDTWFWDFEVRNTDLIRQTHLAGSDPGGNDPTTPGYVARHQSNGINVHGVRTKLINMVIHDAGNGVGFWKSAVNSEIYGCLIYNNGWVGPDRGHGHGLYIQNETGTKRVTDVISFNNFATGMKVYGATGPVTGVTFDGVISFNNGEPASVVHGHMEENLKIAPDGKPADRIVVINSHLYHRPLVSSINVTFGYEAAGNGSLRVEGNRVMGGDQAVMVRDWQSLTFRKNTLHNEAPLQPNRNGFLAKVPSPLAGAVYLWDDNTYTSNHFDPRGFSYAGARIALFEDWRIQSGLDAASTHRLGRPSGQHVTVRPNKYASGRANIIVYNWSLSATATADPSAVLKVGQPYEVRNAQDYFAPPLLSGIYDGKPLVLSLLGLTAATPIGYAYQLTPVGPEFAAFVLVAR